MAVYVRLGPGGRTGAERERALLLSFPVTVYFPFWLEFVYCCGRDVGL